jgi:hypothetical protein
MNRTPRTPSVRKELARELLSTANLLRRPLLDSSGTQLGKLTDVVVRPMTGVPHPPVTGLVAAVGKGQALVGIDALRLRQSAAQLSSAKALLRAPPELSADKDLCLNRDILDHQLVDVDGVQVVRAADVFLALTGDGWVLGGVDVGVWAFLRRLLPRAGTCPPPRRFLDWAELYALLPSANDSGAKDVASGAQRSVQLAASVRELRMLKAPDVARLLQGVSRHHQAQLTLALAGVPSVTTVLRELEGPKLDALLAELEPDDRSRLLSLIRAES